MMAAPIHLAGERLMLDPLGGLFWPDAGLLAVSDLHLEKGSSFARKGKLLPPWDTHATLDRLTILLRRWRPRMVVTLGDSFHDPDGAGRLPKSEVDRLIAMTEAHRFIWVLGNHDPRPADGIGGHFVTEFVTHPISFRHAAVATADGVEIVGHHHPKATIPARGATLTRPCFVAGPKRLMLPAFGAYTGGLDVREPEIARLFPMGGRIFLLGRDRLFSFELGRLRQT
jgi:DNA ligase-associated metallophosphoesterase